MLQNDCPRWMAPINLVAGFVGLILALLSEFGAGIDFKGGAVVFIPLALIVVLLSTVICVIGTIHMLRKSMTWLESIIRTGCAVVVPGVMALLALIAGKTADSGIKTVSLVYTLLFIAALTAFWWFHTIPIVDYAAEIMVAVMICTNYKMVASMPVGVLWLHRIVCLLALMAMVWGACSMIGDDGPIMGLVGLAAPLVSGIIWMVFEATNKVASYVWMLIPIGVALFGTFLVCGFVYGFIQELFGGSSSRSSFSGGSSSSSFNCTSSGTGKTPDPHGRQVSSYVRSGDFKTSDYAWNVRVDTNGNTIYVTGTYRVEKEKYQAAMGFFTESYLIESARSVVESGLRAYASRYAGPNISVRYKLRYELT